MADIDPSNHPRIEMVPPGTLSPNPKNPRRHSDKQLAQIGQSILKFGFLVPIVINETGLIVAGAGRWAAAVSLGIEYVPVIRASFITEADRRAFALAENRLGDLSDWDDELLSAELGYLFEQDYDLDVTGFSLSDLDLGMSHAEDLPEEAVEPPDVSKPAVSQPGDLWTVANQNIYCGNARDTESYDRLLGNARANMVFADPPYNVPVMGHVAGLGKAQYKEFAEASGEMTPLEFTGFLRQIFRQCRQFSVDGSIHYHCMDWRHIREMLDAADGVYSEFKQLVVWAKDNAGMGSFYRSQHELVFIFKSGKSPHINNFGLGKSGRYRTNVWTYPGANSFRKGRARDLADHPTVKSLAMVADAILDCSNPGDLVLDPFSGSGTTLVAAHRMRRKGAAIEIDPHYVDVAVRRLQEVSGVPAILADGRSFEAVAADRALERENSDD